jgi:hypothetical protein
MTGYQSKKKAASAKTINEVNWLDHEPDGRRAAAQEPAIGDIRALKHRIHELEGEIIGYKRLLDAQPAQEPVGEVTEVTGSGFKCEFSQRLAAGTKLYAAPPQPAQDPVAWQCLGSAHFRKKLPKNADITAWNPLYTTPPQRPWVDLTAEEAAECWTTSATQTWKNFEAKLKDKNNGT